SRPAPRLVSFATRAIAGGASHVNGVGLVELTLKLSGRYAALVRARGGVSASVSLSFIAPARPTLHEQLTVTFVRAVHRRARSSAGRESARRESVRGRNVRGGRRW
ncbi:MAG: hypothetical protein WA484_14965, partial [Solirubrobacteraceae bacterium]